MGDHDQVTGHMGGRPLAFLRVGSCPVQRMAFLQSCVALVCDLAEAACVRAELVDPKL